MVNQCTLKELTGGSRAYTASLISACHSPSLSVCIMSTRSPFNIQAAQGAGVAQRHWSQIVVCLYESVCDSPVGLQPQLSQTFIQSY